MSGFLLGHLSLFELVLVSAVLAYSQYIVLRAGVFSMATAGFASLGAYARRFARNDAETTDGASSPDRSIGLARWAVLRRGAVVGDFV